MRKHWPVILFFGVYISMGILLLNDYGMSWDEAVQRRHGLVALDQIIEQFDLNVKPFAPEGYTRKHPSRYYPVFFSMMASLVERGLGIEEDFVRRYYVRHLLTFLVFNLGLGFMYSLIFQATKNTWLGVLGLLLVVLHPRLFAHAFYNPKDIILLGFYAMGTYTLLQFYQHPTWQRAIWHGIACGLAINTRMPAVILPAMTIGLFLTNQLWSNGKWVFRLQKMGHLLVSIVVTVGVTLLFFPYLWTETLSRSAQTFEVMAKYPWGSSNLFFGSFIQGDQTPWYYIPAWIGLTTPLPMLAAIVVGIGLTLWGMIRKPTLTLFGKPNPHQIPSILLGLSIGPILAVIILESTLYNGWRHLYFVYPLLAAILAIQFGNWWTIKKASPRNSALLAGAGLFLFLPGLVFMVQHHPHQQVYFNQLAPPPLAENFDMDYWGVSYRQGLKKLAAMASPTHPIKVRCANYPCEDNYRYLPATDRRYLELVWDTKQADVFISNFRRLEDFQKFQQKVFPYEQPLFFIEVNGQPILGAFSLSNEGVQHQLN